MPRAAQALDASCVFYVRGGHVCAHVATVLVDTVDDTAMAQQEHRSAARLLERREWAGDAEE